MFAPSATRSQGQSASDSSAPQGQPRLALEMPSAAGGVVGAGWNFGATPVFPPESSGRCGGASPEAPGQSRLVVRRPHDSLEDEADDVAGRVMRMPARAGSEANVRSSAVPLAEATSGEPVAQSAAALVNETLRAPGQPLDSQTRQFFEPRFGHDFARVLVHTDDSAARSARAISARAYTVRNHLVFGQGEFMPDTRRGERLLAHELAHVVQHRNVPTSGRVSDTVVSRATLEVGGVAAEVDYGDLIDIPVSRYPATIKSNFQAYAGAPLAAALVTQIAGFSTRQQEWLLFGLDVLSKNTAQAPGLDRVKAFDRLVKRAPDSMTRGLGTRSLAFEQEVLTVSGWFEIALTKGLAKPSADDLKVIDPLFNPPPAASAPPAGVFDPVTFKAELPGLTRARLAKSALDPANWSATRTEPLGQLQSLGDVIQEQARAFFAPYAEAARENTWLTGTKYSSLISSVTTDALGASAPVPKEGRLALLRNRASAAGWDDAAGPSLFTRTNFDPDRDSAAFDAIIASLDADPAVFATLERQYRHTGHTEYDPLKVHMATEVSGDISECKARWMDIRTLCHELMHAMVNPDFEAAISSSPRFPHGIDFAQLLREGCAEVLGVQLFNDLRKRALKEDVLQKNLLQGVGGVCVPPSNVATPGYQKAGESAEAIRARVGDQRFRAAYFLGQVSLMGL